MWKVEPTEVGVEGDIVSQSRDPVKVDCDKSKMKHCINCLFYL